MRLTRFSLLVAALAPALVTAQQQDYLNKALKDPSIPALLKKAIRDNPKLRYTGTRVVEFRDGVDRRRHTELVIRDGDKSRVEFPEGSPFAGQIIVEKDGKRYHYFPGKSEIRVMPARREEAFFRIFRPMRDKSVPKFTVGGSEGIAGVTAQQVTASDERGNVLQRFWIHSRSGLILKRELYDRAGTLVGMHEFTRVNFKPTIRSSDFDLKIAGAKLITPDIETQRLAREHGMLYVVLPANEPYKLEFARILKVGEATTMMQTYVGPKNRITLFQVKGEVQADRLRQMARGDFRVYAWEMKGRNFALIGDVDSEELRRIARRLSNG